ncbi:MAG: hypothetical protein E4H18_06240 [Hyphomicrobiales bacterium]|nr:MAG: hypothetical protein E4H18_06240 [Hyphomicrobiales bacterium]
MLSLSPFRPVLKILPVMAAALCVAANAAVSAPLPNACGTQRLDRMVGQMIMVGFPGDDEKDAGVQAVRRQLADGVIGGVVLFPENIASPTQVKSLIAFLRNARSTPPITPSASWRRTAWTPASFSSSPGNPTMIICPTMRSSRCVPQALGSGAGTAAFAATHKAAAMTGRILSTGRNGDRGSMAGWV